MPGSLYQLITDLFDRHRGKTVGAIVGLIFALVVIIFGFWKSIFIIICICLGYLLGKQFDDDRGNALSAWWERLFGER